MVLGVGRIGVRNTRERQEHNPWGSKVMLGTQKGKFDQWEVSSVKNSRHICGSIGRPSPS